MEFKSRHMSPVKMRKEAQAESHGNQAPAVRTTNLRISFADRPILKGVDLDVMSGSTVAVSGESGCGKSTLLGLIGGLDRPSSGQIMVDGRQIGSLDEIQLSRYRNREVGFIFQFHFLLRDFTALENVVMPGMLGNLSGRKRSALTRTLTGRKLH